ncbi:MAG: baseplate J/gp47 family protein [Dokdonella sp.]|uniref:baseplate J/gp47 family protein n=1 Tax=Dokdonella sp. TaxID=2291710 RepID=UPI003F7D47E4
MPFARPTLKQLRQQVQQDIASALPGSDPLLRFSNLGILADVLAALANMHYGYLDWIASQGVPFTATDEYLEAWAALKNVTRKPAAVASGTITFTGTNGTVLPSGTPLQRADGQQYLTTATGTVASGSVTVPAAAVADHAGLVGAGGNCDAGVQMTLASAIAGLNSTGVAATAFVGGADLETDDSLRARMLLAYQQPPHGGDATDYVEWALAVPGVTRAWCVPNALGVGTVAVYTMFDAAEAAHSGFPQGTDGVSQHDAGPDGLPRAAVATGDQLTVADAIFALQPVTALVSAKAPTPQSIPFVISGIAGASADTRAAIAAAIAAVFLQYAAIQAGGSTLSLSYIESAIAAVPNTTGFVIESPTGNIVSTGSQLPVVGPITYV